MVRVQFYAFYWSLFVMGLFYMLRQCDARAVNVSNTWTMPQEGLNVFYRFFRDRISWFEADAVCQFHHANLVTVDNSFQFDGTRDLLRELDVNDIVWIGLMRPQSSERFMWSNSKPLVADTGYWAESLPLMDAPLCAVIDPIRDYRWHALRCGGPETASFLCEMPVPNWAEACIIKDMPNLTMQYMADTASVELIRNCQEEGLLRAACKGKQDRSQVSQTLICPRERLETQRINDITNSHFKSLQIIDGISTDNNENNNIELLPMEASYGSNAPLIVYPQNVPTEKNAVQRLIEQFNVDELMEADEPKIQIQNINDFYKLNAPIPKPVKKSAKSLTELSKKDVIKQTSKSDREEADEEAHFKKNMEDMMMGDQPMGEPEMAENILNDVVSNEIMEHLPHTKKVMPQDLHTMAIIQEKLKKNREGKYTIVVETATISTPDTLSDKVSSKDNKKMSLIKHKEHTTHDSSIGQQEQQQIPTVYSTSVIMPQVTSSTLGTITHPIHPQPQSQSHYQPPPPPPPPLSNNEQSPRTVHIKETPNNSHFIPPMLLVKSHYVPNSKHGHTTIHGDHHNDRLSIEDNEKVFELPEQRSTTLSTELSQSNLVKTAVTTFQNMDETTKLIMNGSQQKVTDNLEVVAEQETNRTKHDNNSHRNENNNNRSAGIVAVTVPSVQDEMKLSTTLQTIKPKTTQQQQKKQQQQIKLNLDESTQSTADRADLQKIISQQNQQQHDDTNKSSTANIEADTAQLMTETTKSTITTEKMHDLVEGKLKKELRNAPNTQIPKTETDKVTGTEMMSGVETVVPTTIRSTITTTTAAAETAPPMTMTTTTTTTKLMEAQKEYNEQQQQQQQQLPLTTSIITTTTPEVQTKSQRKSTTAEVTETEIHTKQKNTDTREISATTQNQPTNSFAAITEKRTQQIGDGDRKITMKRTETTATATIAPTADAGININIKTPTLAVKSNEKITDIKDIITSSKQDTQHIMYVAGEEPTEKEETLNIKQRAAGNAAVAAATTNNAKPTFSAITTFIYSTTTTAPPTTTRNFLKVTTEQPYKPNRRRSLTKPETVSYIKKILG